MMKKAIDVNAGVIRFTFEGLEPIVFTVNKASEQNNDYAVFNGYCHNIGDCAALSRTLPDGTVRTITEQMRREAIKARVDYLESGATEWDRKGARVAPQNPTILAIATKRGCTYAEAEVFLANQFLADEV